MYFSQKNIQELVNARAEVEGKYGSIVNLVEWVWMGVGLMMPDNGGSC